jgi:hypothetical protein
MRGGKGAVSGTFFFHEVRCRTNLDGTPGCGGLMDDISENGRKNLRGMV